VEVEAFKPPKGTAIVRVHSADDRMRVYVARELPVIITPEAFCILDGGVCYGLDQDEAPAARTAGAD